MCAGFTASVRSLSSGRESPAENRSEERAPRSLSSVLARHESVNGVGELKSSKSSATSARKTSVTIRVELVVFMVTFWRAFGVANLLGRELAVERLLERIY